jgi:hypothetical protein
MILYDDQAAMVFYSEFYFKKPPWGLNRIQLKHDVEEAMIKKLFVVGIGLLLVGMVSCSKDEPETSAEKAQESLNKAVESSKKAASDMTAAAKEAVDEAVKAAKEMAHDAAEATEEAARDAKKATK